MKIVVGPLLWEKLHAEEEYEYVRSALYLGYGIEHTADVARSRFMQTERESVIECAKRLGIDDSDRVILDRSVAP